MKIEPKHVILSELLREFGNDAEQKAKELKKLSTCDGCGREMTADELELKCRKLFPHLLEMITETQERRKKLAESNPTEGISGKQVVSPDELEEHHDETLPVLSVIIKSEHEEEISPELKAAEIEKPGAETKSE